MDFYGYWHQPLQPRYAVRGTGINTTFYFQDNAPGVARLTFVKNGHKSAPPPELFTAQGSTSDHAAFERWCYQQEQVTIYPKAGDAVLFFSHIPHQGAKEDAEAERSNVVCHYQCNPFYSGLAHVSAPLGDPGVFPLRPVA